MEELKRQEMKFYYKLRLGHHAAHLSTIFEHEHLSRTEDYPIMVDFNCILYFAKIYL